MASFTGDPAAPLVPDFNGHDFNESGRPEKLHQLSLLWEAHKEECIAERTYPRLNEDPLLSPAAPEDRK